MQTTRSDSNGIVLAIGVVTRERRQMLAACLDSLAHMDRPQDCRLVFIVVENDTAVSVGDLTERLADATGCEVLVANEPVSGIPPARNRVLDMALAHGADHLTFIDDDETVATDWLVRLWSYHHTQDLDLTGGPVMLAPVDRDASRLQRLVHAGMAERNRRVQAKAAANVRRGRQDRVTVITSNWMCRLSTQRRTGIRFDESIGLSGGSDTLFFHQFRQAGARSGWAVDAIVHETVPRSRLTFGYQFRRGRDQSIAAFNNRHRGRKLAWPRAIVFAMAKTLLGVTRIVAGVFTRGRSIVGGVRALGMAWGRLMATAGAQSSHYRERHGS